MPSTAACQPLISALGPMTACWLGKLQRFKTVINELRAVHELTNETTDAWDLQIDDIERTMYTYHAPVPREKRGIINLFGVISKTLFATATDADVLECKRQVHLVGRMTERVVHSVSQMLPVINQTCDQLVQNRKHILSLQHCVRSITLYNVLPLFSPYIII